MPDPALTGTDSLSADQPDAKPAPAAPRHRDPDRWWLVVGAVCAGALLVRVGYVLWLEHPTTIGGDAYVYHYGANLLVTGKGFIDPYAYNVLGQTHQSAQHPPLYTVVLALPSVLGLDTFLDHQLWSCLMGTATIAVIAVVGRRLAGPRTGLVAAGLAAGYPNLWIPDGMVAAETLSLLVTAVVLACAYRFWDRPSMRSAALLGVAGALAGLTRAEAVILLPLIVLPWLLVTHRRGLRRRVGLVAMCGAAATVTLGPWVGYNLVRYDHPELITTGLDLALVQANCNKVYYGPQTGYFAFSCIPSVPGTRGDESDDAAYFHRVAVDYVKAHASRVPFVVFARVGRTWGFYQPLQEVRTDSYLQGWNLPAAQAGFSLYLLMVPLAAVGLVALGRRRVPVSPLVATLITVSVATAIAFGQTRYRVTAEVTVVLLAAVGIDWAWTGLRNGSRLRPARS